MLALHVRARGISGLLVHLCLCCKVHTVEKVFSIGIFALAGGLIKVVR